MSGLRIRRGRGCRIILTSCWNASGTSGPASGGCICGVKEVFALAADYGSKERDVQLFFRTAQNKLHFAVTGKTAPELIAKRADASKPNMGLTTWKGGVVRKPDVTVAKNYLSEEEIAELNRIVTMFLDFAEVSRRGGGSRSSSRIGRRGWMISCASMTAMFCRMPGAFRERMRTARPVRNMNDLPSVAAPWPRQRESRQSANWSKLQRNSPRRKSHEVFRFETQAAGWREVCRERVLFWPVSARRRVSRHDHCAWCVGQAGCRKRSCGGSSRTWNGKAKD